MTTNFIVSQIRGYLKSMTDVALIRFFRVHILPELSRNQQLQLQEMVNAEVGMSVWMARIQGDDFQAIANQLDLGTIQKLQGVLDEAAERRRRNPVIPMGPALASPGPADEPYWVRSRRHG